MFSWCQSHLKWYPKAAIKLQSRSQAPRITNKAAKQPAAGGEGGEGQQLSSQAGAKMPRYKDFFPRARHFVYFPRFPTSAGNFNNHSFLHPDTEMARYHDNLLFTIQKLCFHDAKAT